MYRWLCTATDARSSSLVGYLLRPSERVHIVKNAAHNIIQVVLSESLATLEERVYAAWVCKHIHTCRIRKNNIGKWTVKLLLTPPKGITRAVRESRIWMVWEFRGLQTDERIGNKQFDKYTVYVASILVSFRDFLNKSIRQVKQLSASDSDQLYKKLMLEEHL